jgi:hypothetical protein
VPWEALNIIMSDVIYDGRVTDKQDVRLTRAIVSSYLDPQTIAQPTTLSYCSQMDAKYRYCAPPEGQIDTFASSFPLVGTSRDLRTLPEREHHFPNKGVRRHARDHHLAAAAHGRRRRRQVVR